MSNLMIYLFVLQIIFAILLIAIVLMQSSEEDALSGIGGSIGSGSILSHKSSVDLITKVTIILGCCLIVNSLALTVISKNRYTKNETIVEDYLKKQGKQLNSKTEVEEKKEEIKNIEETAKNTENNIVENSEENKEKVEEKEIINNEVKVEENIENKNIEANKNNNIINEKVIKNTNK